MKMSEDVFIKIGPSNRKKCKRCGCYFLTAENREICRSCKEEIEMNEMRGECCE